MRNWHLADERPVPGAPQIVPLKAALFVAPYFEVQLRIDIRSAIGY